MIMGGRRSSTEGSQPSNPALFLPPARESSPAIDSDALIQIEDGTLHAIGNGGMRLYAKRISSNSSPAKTSIIITGEESGAVYEYDVTVSYYTS